MKSYSFQKSICLIEHEEPATLQGELTCSEKIAHITISCYSFYLNLQITNLSVHLWPKTSKRRSLYQWITMLNSRPVLMSSSSLPGVPQTTSTPALRALICSLTGSPPTTSSDRTLGLSTNWPKSCICFRVCSASSRDGWGQKLRKTF